MRIAVLVVILVLISVAIILLFNIKVTKVTCVTQYGVCPDELLNHLPDLKSLKWVDGVPTDRLTSAFAAFPPIKKISVTKKIPGTLDINIILRKPLGVVYSSVNQAQVVVDDEGWLFESADMSNLPRLVVDSPLEIGSKLGETELSAIHVLYTGSVIMQENLNAKIIDTALEIKNSKGLLIVISLTQTNSDWRIPLQAILARSKIDGKVPHKIDLRFADPIVVY